MVSTRFTARLPDDLPIIESLPTIATHLASKPNLVLQAPPGAGKTTGVPLSLLDAPWCAADHRIIMLEPRRIAAKAAARRMAALLGEAVGETIGYRIRFDSMHTQRTRILIVTDGIFTRMIQDDPGLDRIACVLFDECHERRLDTDLALAFCLESQEALRPDLRLIAMSATLDAAPLAALMRDAPIVTSAGRAFPVAYRWQQAPTERDMPATVAAAIRTALNDPGDLLVFLPGGREIRRVERLLRERPLPPHLEIHPLYGDLDPVAQDRAIALAPAGTRKIVLSTSIAETSLTIDGIRQVIDSGFARSSRFDPRTGMTRLETDRITQAAADQRAGRAGRTAPGLCWRLWTEIAHKGFAPRPAPEIATVDLARLCLDLACWGVRDTQSLRLLDPPDPAAFAVAVRLLTRLRALDPSGRITPHGKAMAALGIDPRLAAMVLQAKDTDDDWLACLIAALLGEGGTKGELGGTDLRLHLARLERPQDHGARRTVDLARRIARQVGIRPRPISPSRAGSLLALAFFDRIAQRRAEMGRFRLSGGQGAILSDQDPLAAEAFLVVADLDGTVPESRIWLAAPITGAEIAQIFADDLRVEDDIRFDAATGSVQAKRKKRLDALVLDEQVLKNPPAAAIRAGLLAAIKRSELRLLTWTDAARSLQARIAFMARLTGTADWPAVGDSDLLRDLDDWLGHAVTGKSRIADLAALDLAALLRDRLDWQQQQILERDAPTHLTVPSGSKIPIDYISADLPVLAVKLQEMFGLADHPTIAGGRVRLVIHLLSPARRPIQVTSDLPGFWTGSYKAVRADLRGRYPRHPWPEDPLAAPPTARAKPRGT